MNWVEDGYQLRDMLENTRKERNEFLEELRKEVVQLRYETASEQADMRIFYASRVKKTRSYQQMMLSLMRREVSDMRKAFRETLAIEAHRAREERRSFISNMREEVRELLQSVECMRQKWSEEKLLQQSEPPKTSTLDHHSQNMLYCEQNLPAQELAPQPETKPEIVEAIPNTLETQVDPTDIAMPLLAEQKPETRNQKPEQPEIDAASEETKAGQDFVEGESLSLEQDEPKEAKPTLSVSNIDDEILEEVEGDAQDEVAEEDGQPEELTDEVAQAGTRPNEPSQRTRSSKKKSKRLR
jgi:ribosomal protein L29